MSVRQVVAVLKAHGFDADWDRSGQVSALIGPEHHGGSTAWWERVPMDEFSLMHWIHYGA